MSSILVDAASTNYKKKYCNKQEFVTDKTKTPHLHCGKGFFTLKHKNKNGHENFVQGSKIMCANLFKVLGNPNRYGAFYRFVEIEKSMMNFAKKECNRNTGEKKLYKKALVVYNKVKADGKNKMSKNKKNNKRKTKVGRKMEFINKQNKKFGKGIKKTKGK